MSEEYSETTPRKYVGRLHKQIVTFAGDESTVTNEWDRVWEDYRQGVKNPRWREQVRSGIQAGTPFEGNLVKVSVVPFYLSMATYVNDGYSEDSAAAEIQVNHGTWCRDIPNDPAGLSEALANNRAKEQIVRKIRNKQTSFEGGVFIGELLRTVKLIRNPAMALRKGVGRYMNVLKKNGPKVKGLSRKRVTEIVRDTWLEAQLGWAPLLNELDNGIKTIAESGVLSDPDWTPVRAVGVDEKSYNLGTYNLGTGFPNFEVDIVTKDIVTVRYIACVDIGTYSATSARRVGFAPTNWLPTVWELIPYSFVVDYFTNIGTIISAATLAKSSTRWMLKTVRKERVTGYYSWRPMVSPNNARYSFGLSQILPGKSSISRRTVERYPYYGDLVPSLVIELPYSNTQWLNIAALWDARRDLKRYYR